jgi:hypothetical protein
MSSSFRSVAGQDGGGELAGGIISGGSGVEAGGVTMMPAGGEGAVSAAGGGCGSVSAQRRSAEKRQPSATAPTTVISLFIQPISLRPVPLYSDPGSRGSGTPVPRCSADTERCALLGTFPWQVRKRPVDSSLSPSQSRRPAFLRLGANRQSLVLFPPCSSLALAVDRHHSRRHPPVDAFARVSSWVSAL